MDRKLFQNAGNPQFSKYQSFNSIFPVNKSMFAEFVVTQGCVLQVPLSSHGAVCYFDFCDMSERV